MTSHAGPPRAGVGGPVATGKAAAMDALCRVFALRHGIAAITNGIYTEENTGS